MRSSFLVLIAAALWCCGISGTKGPQGVPSRGGALSLTLLACMGLCGTTSASAAEKAPAVTLIEMEEAPYRPPQLIPDILPDKFEDNLKSPPAFLVNGEKAIKQHKMTKKHRAQQKAETRSGYTISHGPGVGAAAADPRHDLGAANTEQSKVKFGHAGWSGNDLPVVGREIANLHQDDADAPPNGPPCGDRPDLIPCTDNKADGGSVSPGGEPRHLQPSHGKNPELDLEYRTPHAEFFTQEPDCETDVTEVSFNKLEQQLEVEHQRQADERAFEKEHMCVGMVKMAELMFNELKVKVGNRRRTMNRKNALPFTQEEKAAALGPHRRLLMSEDASGLIEDDPTSDPSDGDGGGSEGGDSGSGSGSGSSDGGTEVSPADETKDPDGDTMGPRPSPQIAPYKMPFIELKQFDKGLKDTDDCLMKVSELIPMLSSLRAMSAKEKEPIYEPLVETALKLGTPPPPEPTRTR